MTSRNLGALLNPKSVAVFGATDRSGSVGATVWRNLRSAGFGGPLRAVNPKHAALDGEPVFASAADLPETPDLAVVCTPPASVAAIIEQIGRRGARAAIILTAGLGADEKTAALRAAQPHLLRLLGPNCIGLTTPRLGLNATFAHTDALAGDVAFVSQSGALVTAVLDWAKSRRIGFSHMISVGESLDVDFGDLLDHLASDPNTRSILLYIESIQAPRKFMSAARAAARNKPVIVVKAGRAGNGVRAAASHTGALAASDLVFDAAFRRAGMLRVETLQDLLLAAETLARFGANQDHALTIMTNGGGAGVMAADAAAFAGVALPEPSAALRAALAAVLPPTWSRGNPIDIIGDAPVERYTATLKALLDDRSAGAILFLHAPTAIVRSEDIARACVPIARQGHDRVLSCWLGDASVSAARQIFEAAGVADFETPEEAVRAFAMLSTYRRNQELLLEVPTASESAPPDVAAARAIVRAALREGRTLLGEFDAKQLLRAYAIPVVETVVVAPTAAAAADAAEALGYPVALKIVSPEITHKSDVGGVCLDLADAQRVRSAAAQMLQRVTAERPEAHIAGFTVQPMAQRPFAQELIVGASIDPLFGPVLLFGQGGTAVEVLADRAIGLPPLNRALARALIERTRVARLLGRYRDHPPAKIDAIGDVLVALSQMLVDLPELSELDINPLWADQGGVLALDARVRLDAAAPAGAAHFAITPYPAELIERIAWDGGGIEIRPIRPEDEPQHRVFLARLTAEDMRTRFFGWRNEFPASEIARMTQIDYAREMAFIAVRAGVGGERETIGVARAACDPDNVEAELGIVVRSDLKTRGLGRLMLRKIIDYLAARGTERLVAIVLKENLAMRGLAAAEGFVADAARGDVDSVWLVLPLQGAGDRARPA
jgi:acetyltransferase